MGQSSSSGARRPHVVNNFPAFHATRRFTILILSSHLLLRLLRGLRPFPPPPKTLPLPLRATCPAHIILLDLI